MAMASTSVATTTISLEDSVKAGLRRVQAQQGASHTFTIFRVPAYIRESNPTAFQPRMVSIGPYYHGSPSLRAMEDHKWRCLHHLLRQYNIGIDILIQKIRSLEPEARACYCESPQLGPEKFVRMLLLDACFIIVFYCFRSECGEPNVGWGRTLINTDLLLLENQIPFFVVVELYTTAMHYCDREREREREDFIFMMKDQEHLLNLIPTFLSNEEPIARPSAVEHLLHLYYQCFVPKHPSSSSSPTCREESKETAAATRRGKEMSVADVVRLMKTAADRCMSIITQCGRRKRMADIEQPKEVPVLDYYDEVMTQAASVTLDIEQQQPKETATAATTTIRGIPCAKEMSAAGVTIVVRRPKESRHKYDVTFDRKRGVMEIPAMVVDDMTQRPLLMNLIAFEQTQTQLLKASRLRSLVVTSYVTLMSMVIRRENDVELLRRAEILDNLLADDNEAARFFSHLADGVAMDYDNQRFAQLYKDVQAYCRSWRHRNRAVLMRDYFGSPWSAIAVVAAALVFVLTATQTYFTVFPAKG